MVLNSVQPVISGILAFILHIVLENTILLLFTIGSLFTKPGLMLSGVAIGGGWQGIVAYINLGCYYIFGLPFGFILGYTVGWGVTVSIMFMCL